MSDEPTRDHNTKARKAMIANACRELIRLDEQISELQKEKAAIKKDRIKGDLGMTVSDFNIALKVYKLEGDARNNLFDTLQECFTALNVGAQLNFLDAVGAEKTVAPPKRRRGRPRKVTPESLGETVNKPHQPIDNIDEPMPTDAPSAVADEHEDPDDSTSENDEEAEREGEDGDDQMPPFLKREQDAA